jgi:hypothetical protein
LSDDFRFLMIGAMYENGGNTTHRHLDGHPGLYVYPYESQIGTRLVNDMLSSTFPLKYRWPTFDSAASPAQDYHAIIDEEGKVRARTPFVSKFRDEPFDLSDDERRDIFVEHVEKTDRTRADNVAAFYRATFEAWKDFKRSGENQVYVGYSPIITVDAERILDELPGARFLHIVRNPWSAYADTRKRAVPLSLPNYMLGWTLNQHYALQVRRRFPDRFHLIRIEDVMADPKGTLSPVVEGFGLEAEDSLTYPSWNSRKLEQVYPWGTIRLATTEQNLATANELSDEEKQEVAARTTPFAEILGYEGYLAGQLDAPSL